MKRNLWILFGTVSLVGCLDAGEESDAEMLGVTESALCIVPTQPGTPSQSRTVPEHGGATMNVASYGTSECSRVTVELKTTLTADAMVNGITTQAACEGTRVTSTYFYAEPTGSQNWVRDQTISGTGRWENNSCRRPIAAYNAPSTHVVLPVPPYHVVQFLPRDVRMVVSAQRTICTPGPNGLELCATTYGVPMLVAGRQQP